MPTTEAQKRATQKYRQAHSEQLKNLNRKHWAKYYAKNIEKMRERGRKCYIFRKEYERLRKIDIH